MHLVCFQELCFIHLSQRQWKTKPAEKNTYILHKADTRGHANHGWLESYHSFSFAGYQIHERMNFGVQACLMMTLLVKEWVLETST
jgi:hypothetical protein